MKRVNMILKHPQYIENLKKIAKAEENRVFCLHNLQHFLDVARVAYIKALEKSLIIEKEIIYATALLHDIGRWKQYQDRSDHAMVSAEFAKDILEECGFHHREIQIILQAIRKHRRNQDHESDLDRLIYEGDKESRLCVECPMLNECNRFLVEKEILIDY